jgi:hypothetical protein
VIPVDSGIDNELFVNYILNPRVANELLVPWRGYLMNEFRELAEEAPNNPIIIKNYVDKAIKIADADNYYNTPLTPRGVHQLKVSDSESRSIYFVAICRALGIPSRLEPGSNIPQYYFNSAWNDVYFSSGKAPSGAKGFLKLVSSDLDPVPEYYVHFTIAHFEDGHYNTLEYEYNRRITNFDRELQLVPGHYMMVTGNRLNDGNVLSEISFFDLTENQHLTVEVKLRKETMVPPVHRSFNLEEVLKKIPVEKKLSDKVLEKGIVMAWIEPDREPSKHVLNDLPLLKTELDSWGGGFIFLMDPASSGNLINFHDLNGRQILCQSLINNWGYLVLKSDLNQNIVFL